MAAAFGTLSALTLAVSTATTVVNIPAVSTGDLIVVVGMVKLGPTSQPALSGYTAQQFISHGTTGSGNDAGSMRGHIWTQTASGAAGATTVTITWGTTPNAGQAFSFTLTKGSTETWSVASTAVARTATTTAWSVTYPADPGLAVSDFVAAINAVPTDLNTASSAGTLTATGLTSGSATARVAHQVDPGGSDSATWFDSYTPTGGPSSAVATYASTLTGGTNLYGVSMLFRARAEPPATTLYARAAGGTWGTASTWSVTSNGPADGFVPRAIDPVILNASSGAVTISAAAAAKSLTCTGYTNTLTQNAELVLEETLTCSATMTWTSSLGSQVDLKFSGTPASTYSAPFSVDFAGINVGTAGASFVQVIFGSVAGNAVYQTTAAGVSILGSGQLQHNRGGLRVLGSISAVGYKSSTNVTRNLWWEAGVLNATGVWGGAWQTTGTTSELIQTLHAGFYVTLAPTTTAAGPHQIDVRSSMPPVRWLRSGGTATTVWIRNLGVITDLALSSLIDLGANAGITLRFDSGRSYSIGANTYNFTGVAIDADVAASAATLNATTGSMTVNGGSLKDNTGEAGFFFYSATTTIVSNVTGWSPVPIPYYARAAGGTWSTAATWSLTSNGPADGAVPTSTNPAVFDASSGNVTGSAGMVCKSLTMTGYTGTFTASNTVDTYDGDVVLPTGGTVTSLTLSMHAANGKTVNLTSRYANGKSFATVNLGGNAADTGTYNLLDDVQASSSFSHSYGTLNVNAVTVRANDFYWTGTGQKNFGSGTLRPTMTSGAAWQVDGTNPPINAGTSTIVFPTSVTAVTFSGGYDATNGRENTYYDIDVSGTSGSVQVSSVYQLRNLTAVGSRTLKLAGTTIVTGTPLLQGTNAAARFIIESWQAGTTATLSKASGTVSATSVSLKDNTAQGGATWSYDVDSVVLSNVTGWTGPPRALAILGAGLLRNRSPHVAAVQHASRW